MSVAAPSLHLVRETASPVRAALGALLRVRKRLSRGRLHKGKFESLCCLMHELGA